MLTLVQKRSKNLACIFLLLSSVSLHAQTSKSFPDIRRPILSFLLQEHILVVEDIHGLMVYDPEKLTIEIDTLKMPFRNMVFVKFLLGKTRLFQKIRN